MIESADERAAGGPIAVGKRCLALVGGTAAVTAMVAPFAAAGAGWLGLVALGCAAASCLAGGLCGEAVSHAFGRPTEPLERLLASMLCRMFIPLGILLVLVVERPTLVAAGAAYYFIVLYGVMLAIEVWLLIQQVRAEEAERG
jgi:hypothetical protein